MIFATDSIKKGVIIVTSAIFSTDAPYFGGGGMSFNEPVQTVEEPFNKFRHRLQVKLPAYGAVFFKFTPAKTNTPKGEN